MVVFITLNKVDLPIEFVDKAQNCHHSNHEPMGNMELNSISERTLFQENSAGVCRHFMKIITLLLVLFSCVGFDFHIVFCIQPYFPPCFPAFLTHFGASGSFSRRVY